MNPVNSLWLYACILFLPFTNVLASTQLELWDSLKSGGLVVLMGHTATPTDEESKTSLTIRDPSCAKERPLSDDGKNQAILIGKTFVEKMVPIEALINSPYCRTTDTAIYAFKENKSTEFLRLWIPLSTNMAEQYQDELVNRISDFHGTGNLLIITHGPNISSISFVSPTNGSALIVKPMGNGEFEELGKIKLF